MDLEQSPSPTKLYLLSVGGKSSFAVKTAALELISELAGTKVTDKRVDRLFFDNLEASSLAIRYCNKNNIAAQEVESYESALNLIKGRQAPEWIFAYLTIDREDGKLDEMAQQASRQGILTQTRTRAKY